MTVQMTALSLPLCAYVRVSVHVCVRMCACACMYNVAVFVFSLMAPVAKDQYSWNNKDATLYVNIVFTGISVVCVVVSIGTKYVVKW